MVITRSTSGFVTVRNKNRANQDFHVCVICSQELDFKVSGFSKSSGSTQVSLTNLCKLGTTAFTKCESKFVPNPSTLLNLCSNCFVVTEHCQELQQHIEFLKEDLKATVIALRTRMEENSTIADEDYNTLRSSGPSSCNLKRTRATLRRAFNPEVAQTYTPETVKVEPTPLRDNEKPKRGRKRKQEIDVDFEITERRKGKRKEMKDVVLLNNTTPFVKLEQLDIKVKVDTNASIIPNQDATRIPVPQPSETEPVKQKRKYTRRKPRKSLLPQEGEVDAGFIVPIIQSVKTEVPQHSVAGLTSLGDTAWLRDNIVPVPKGTIIKTKLYGQYKAYCEVNGRIPPNPATFGKLMKHTFKGIVTTRRLGCRGNSTYCHYGLKIKDNSPLNDGIVEEYDIENMPSTKRRIRKSVKNVKRLKSEDPASLNVIDNSLPISSRLSDLSISLPLDFEAITDASIENDLMLLH